MATITIQGNASGTGTTTLQSGNTNSDFSLTLPAALGTAGQIISTNGAGVLLFVDPPVPFQNNEVLGQTQAIALSFV